MSRHDDYNEGESYREWARRPRLPRIEPRPNYADNFFGFVVNLLSVTYVIGFVLLLVWVGLR